MHTYNPDERAAMTPAGGYRRVTTATQAVAEATGGTAVALTGLSFPIKKGEVWAFRANLHTTGVSGGAKVSISGPATPNLLAATVKGLTSGVTAYSTERLTALDTLSAAYNTSAVSGPIEIEGVFGASVDGTVSLNGANVTNSNSFAFLAGSTLIATRIS